LVRFAKELRVSGDATPSPREHLNGGLLKVLQDHRDRVLAVDLSVAEEWGRLNVPDPLPVIDGLLAATAKVHGLTLATRNVKDVARSGADVVNPFEPGASIIRPSAILPW
jgi:predicted nucleic acid-binding protein